MPACVRRTATSPRRSRPPILTNGVSQLVVNRCPTRSSAVCLQVKTAQPVSAAREAVAWPTQWQGRRSWVSALAISTPLRDEKIAPRARPRSSVSSVGVICINGAAQISSPGNSKARIRAAKVSAAVAGRVRSSTALMCCVTAHPVLFRTASGDTSPMHVLQCFDV